MPRSPKTGDAVLGRSFPCVHKCTSPPVSMVTPKSLMACVLYNHAYQGLVMLSEAMNSASFK